VVVCYAGFATANETVDDIVTININVMLRESVPVILKAMRQIDSSSGFKEVRNGGECGVW